jgi:hypothetical protein
MRSQPRHRGMLCIGPTQAHFPRASLPLAATLKRWSTIWPCLRPFIRHRQEIGNSRFLELRANARMLRAAVRALSDSLKDVIARLPRVVLPAQKDEPRAAAVATAYLRAVDGDFSAPASALCSIACRRTSR